MTVELIVADELAKLEELIEHNIAVAKLGRVATIEVARDLRRIKEDGLYRLNYTSFYLYSKERWGFGESWTKELLAMADGRLRDRSTSPPLSWEGSGESEGDSRLPAVSSPSSQDDPTSQTDEAVEGDEGAAITVASTPVEVPPTPPAPPPKPEPTLPPKLLPAFDEAKAFTALVTQCGKIKTELKRLANTPAGVFLAEGMTRITADLANLQRGISFCKPHEVCPYCKGAGCQPDQPGHKSPCRGTGWVGKGVKGDGQ
jgi:hypothetical protein